MAFKSLAFAAADNNQEAQIAKKALSARYASVDPEDADVIVALGGDGLMLNTLHRYMKAGKPVFGMNRGSVGFLMNAYAEDNLLERIDHAQPFSLDLLRMTATDIRGDVHTALAVNEVSLIRETHMAAKIKIVIDDVTRLEEMICDGVLVSTPAGSTAYNHAVHGPILPLGSPVLAMTPISVFRPRRWRGALLPQNAKVTFEVLNPKVRTVSAAADSTEFREVASVAVERDDNLSPTLLFDPDNDLAERIIKEQFLP